MKTIQRPVKVSLYEPHKTSILQFEDKTSMECYIRGGICWPIVYDTEAGRSQKGFVIVIGLDKHSDKAYVFEEQEFLCVDHVLDEKGLIEYDGVASFFNMAWQKYFCRLYYHHQRTFTHRQYLGQVVRSQTIKPRPQFAEAKWKEDTQAEIVMYDRITRKKLAYKMDGPVHKAIQLRDTDTKELKIKKAAPEIVALLAGLIGIDRYALAKRRPLEVM